jgi:hypothetical protein
VYRIDTDMKFSAFQVAALLLASLQGAQAFVSSRQPCHSSSTSLSAVSSDTRRAFLLTGLSTVVASGVVPANADTGAEVRGIGVTPFNSLNFQYRGNTFGGLKAEDLNEPSISYADFVKRLKAGEVEFVEFLAPDGDVVQCSSGGMLSLG